MRGKNYSPELMQEAEDLYIEARCTYEELAEQLNVPVGTLKRWGGKNGWPQLRNEYYQQQRELSRNLRKVRQNLLAKAVEKPGSQDIYAIIKLEQLSHARARKEDVKETDIDRPKLFLEDMEFVAETLKEVDPEGLKVFARNFEIIVNRFKEAAADTRR